MCWYVRVSSTFHRATEQGRTHGIRYYETPFSAVEEKALRTYGWTAGRTDGETDPLIEPENDSQIGK